MNLPNDCKTTPADLELVEKSKRGDQPALAQLIQRHYTVSLRVARSILRNQQDAEDAVQTAYCQAFQHLHDFREEARFSTWITSIVVNQSLMQLRRQRRTTLLSLEDPIGESPIRYFTSREPTPEQSTARREIGVAISRALEKLPNGLRLAYTLHAVSGLPVNEVADQLGLSVSATKSRIFRARCRLESRLTISFGPARCKQAA
jgi:RNA polymerase sigma-70 factor (ECF subfamily)